MRIIIAMLFSMLFLSCNKEPKVDQESYSDDGLIGSWKLDSITTISGYVLNNDDDGTSLEGTVMYVRFEENGKIIFDYDDISGGGTYVFDEYHNVTVTSFSDVNIGSSKSRFVGSFIVNMLKLNRYSGNTEKLLLYFDKSGKVMHCSPQ